MISYYYQMNEYSSIDQHNTTFIISVLITLLKVMYYSLNCIFNSWHLFVAIDSLGYDLIAVIGYRDWKNVSIK